MKNEYKRSDNNSDKNIINFIIKIFNIKNLRSGVVHIHFLKEILYLTFLCILYIGNRHCAERKIRDINELNIQVEDLRADYTTLQSELMYESKQSKIAKRAKRLGLKESKQPPLLIKDFEH